MISKKSLSKYLVIYILIKVIIFYYFLYVNVELSQVFVGVFSSVQNSCLFRPLFENAFLFSYFLYLCYSCLFLKTTQRL
jgi:hypothetical protein